MKLSRPLKRTLQTIDTLPLGARHRSVQKLAAYGYIVLTHSVVDGRVISYKLTDKGRKANQ